MIKNDKRVNLRLSEKIGYLFQQQAKENGMNMSAYVSHLILQIEKQKENQAMINEILKTTQGMFKSPEILDKLIKIEKDKKNEKERDK